jgi:flagellar hook-associated protein 1 FlgK
MRSTFGTINTANTGLNIAQRQLGVTAHNIANANVAGYSRQRYINSAVPAQGYKVQFVSPLRGKEGLGVESLSLDQIRDVFLDRQFRNEQTAATYWEERSKALYYVEDVFNNIDSNSLDGVMASFFNSLQELSKNSTDEAIRTNVVAQAKRLIDVFQTYDRQLTALMEQQNFMLKAKVKHTNQLLDQLAGLNDNIFRFELGGSIANDLRDKRALILDELSSIMDISYEYVPFEPPMFNVYGLELSQLKVYAGNFVGENFSDNLIAWHKHAYHLVLEDIEDGQNPVYDLWIEEMEEKGAADDEDSDLIFKNVWLSFAGGDDPEDYDRINPQNNGKKLIAYDSEFQADGLENYNGGILQSYIDVRDGRHGDIERRGIPHFILELNRMVEHFIIAFNEIHTGEDTDNNGAWTMPFAGNSYVSETGIEFFDSNFLTARTMRLSDKIMESSFNIAASSEVVSRDNDEGHAQTGNNEIVLELIRKIKEGVIDGLDNTMEGFYKNYLGNIASEASISNGFRDSQSLLLHGIQTQRDAISRVSEDEEMTDMIRFQHAYNAASRSITTIDEMLDRLINGTGRVGL